MCTYMENKTVPFYQVDAFTDELFAGNPAGVCPLQIWLPEATMQNIAMENNLSETAFVVRKGDHYELRWFTPNSEVDLCGHATLATAFVLRECLGDSSDTLRFQSASGELKVHYTGGKYWMNFPVWKSKPRNLPPALEESLKGKAVDCFEANDFHIVLQDECAVRDYQPDFEMLSSKIPPTSRGVVISAPGDSSDIVSRAFFPNLNVSEDPVTGSTHCALTPYWAEKLSKDVLTARQLSERGGNLDCRVEGERVVIGGAARRYLTGEITYA